ncbi:HAD family hydrolase [Marinomonas polaris]|uniref:HAD family hydrolase n=1 Tax=Marinomonas polaris TaxID=293552 RepID=UPI003F9B44F9
MVDSSATDEIVFLLDVDNTLLDNGRILVELRAFLIREIGIENSTRYWEIFERLRTELGYADYLGALQQYRLEYLDDARVLLIAEFILDYPFVDRLYFDALTLIKHLQTLGKTVILTDGEAVLQPRKIKRSGLWEAVNGQVLIYIHKETMLDAIEQHYPAKRYVMVDDKLRILTAMKQAWGSRLTTVFPRQGHYAHDSEKTNPYPAADVTIEHIGELIHHDFRIDLGAADIRSASLEAL